MVVVGLGVVGGAAARHLAADGVAVVGVDRSRPPHPHGSSHGETRITRLATGEGAAYVPLVRRSHELWRALEAETGERCLVQCGGLVLAAHGATGQHGVPAFAQATMDLARRFGIAHEVLDAEEVRARFPVLQVTDEVGYLEPEAGYLRAEACVAAQLRLGERHGADLRLGETARRVVPRRAGVRVETDRGEIDAAAAVVAVGPWLPALEPTLAPLLSVQREAMCWFEIENHADAYARLPIFIWLHGPGPADLCYGFPAVAGPSGGVKVATEVYGEPTTPAAVDRTVTDAEAAAVHAAHVRGRLRGLSPRCHRREVCLYTVTPDFGFVVDTLPGAPQVVIASACSGHGFKHAPAVGEAVAQMALGRAPTQDLAAFSLSRFGERLSRP